jgi:hypothetical protein
MDDVPTTVDAYMAMWNEVDATRRWELVQRAWSETGRYQDPVQACEGQAALSELVANVHAQFPGYRFRRISEIDWHHDQIRFAWEFVAPDGRVTLTGIDIGCMGEDGRLTRVVGFFGPLPEDYAAQMNSEPRGGKTND